MKTIVSIIVFVMFLILVFGQKDEKTEVKELTKQEALVLMDMHYKVLSLEADLKAAYEDRSKMIETLYIVHNIDKSQYNIDIKSGTFVKIEKKEEKK